MQHEQKKLTTLRFIHYDLSAEELACHMVSNGCAANGFVKVSMPCLRNEQTPWHCRLCAEAAVVEDHWNA